MTTNDEFTKFSVLFGGELVVLHVAKVVFTLDLVLVTAGEVVLRKFEGNSKQDVERVQDLGVEGLFSRVRVHEAMGTGPAWSWSTHFSKLLDLGEVIVDDLGVFVFKLLGELGDIIHLDLVS